MFMIHPIANASSFLKQMAAEHLPDARFVSIVQDYSDGGVRRVNLEKHPGLRDRSDEATAMLQGLARDLDAPVTKVNIKGYDLRRKYGFPAVGAQFAQTFDVFFV